MPSSDPITPMKHIRFGQPCPELLEALLTFPGIKAIVLHKRGKKEEHPHYHTFYEGESVTSATLKNRLARHSTHIASAAKTNGFWRCAAHDSWERWANYVMGNPSAEILLDNPDTPLPPVAEVPIVAATPSAAAVVVMKPPTKREPQRVQFVRYLKSIGWTDGCIKFGYIHDKCDEIVKELTEWSENAFTTPNGAAIVQHVLFHFSDTECRNIIVQKNIDAIRKSVRLYSQ